MASILIVDDYMVTQRVLSMQLRKNGYEVHLVSSGKEALVLLAEFDVDLAIVDIAMPEMDGITLLKKIRSESRFVDLPVIMLTASGQDQDRILSQAAGASAFLTKPASSRELLDTVVRCLTLKDQ